ncbi:MAG: CDP-alcohol phosphatidyltransferase family protein [Ruminococcaceae bacterium]|nr:CDP-alcohol phosphatidyltransferase family protein [Oscillospiraceae bacterium]
MNIPNILTTIRLFMVPLYGIVFALEGNSHIFSALVFVLASVTDVADGYIARKYNLSTRWGQVMDPLADKCMQIAVIISLFIAKIVPVWFIVLLVAKELLMIFMSIFLYTKKTYVKSNRAGKINTVFLFLVMLLLLVCPSMNLVLKNVLLGLSAVISVLAGMIYTYLYFVQDKRFKNYTSKGKKKGESL